MTRNAKRGEELFCDYGFIEQYIQAETTVRNIYNMGALIDKDCTSMYNLNVLYTLSPSSYLCKW